MFCFNDDDDDKRGHIISQPTFKVTGPLSFKENPPIRSNAALHSGLT